MAENKDAMEVESEGSEGEENEEGNKKDQEEEDSDASIVVARSLDRETSTPVMKKRRGEESTKTKKDTPMVTN